MHDYSGNGEDGSLASTSIKTSAARIYTVQWIPDEGIKRIAE